MPGKVLLPASPCQDRTAQLQDYTALSWFIEQQSATRHVRSAASATFAFPSETGLHGIERNKRKKKKSKETVSIPKTCNPKKVSFSQKRAQIYTKTRMHHNVKVHPFTAVRKMQDCHCSNSWAWTEQVNTQSGSLHILPLRKQKRLLQTLLSRPR